MDPVAVAAESLLRRHPAPALPLSELLERLREDGPDPYLTEGRLRNVLEKTPERFRILELWRAAPANPLGEGAAAELGAPWVAVISDPTGHPEERERAEILLRESVRWLTRFVDPRSTRDVAHWRGMVHAEARVRALMKAAG